LLSSLLPPKVAVSEVLRGVPELRHSAIGYISAPLRLLRASFFHTFPCEV
jgi:hypothetical protein